MDALYKQALETFNALLEQAQQSQDPEPTAMTVATVGRDGRPAARTVLLKTVDERGFVFFTNFNSRKGRQLAANPQAALLFNVAFVAAAVVAAVLRVVVFDRVEE